jgi:hypothetical protein
MGEYVPHRIKIIELSYTFPFGIYIELLRIPKGFLQKPQYWWLLAIQTNSITSYFTICLFGLIFDWKRKEGHEIIHNHNTI